MFKRYLLNSSSLPDYVTNPFGTFADNGNPDGGGGGNEHKIDLAKILSNPESKKILEDWAEREVAAGLKNKNKELLDNLNKFKVKKEDGTDGGFLDPAEAFDAIMRIKSGGGKEEIEKALAAQKERYEAEITSIRGNLDNESKATKAERQARHNLMITNNLKSTLLDSGVKTGKMHLHENYLKTYLKVENMDGVEKLVVLGDDGKPRYGAAGLMTVNEFVSEYKSKEGVSEDWNATGRTGSGTSPHGGNNRGAGQIDQNLPPAERLRQHRRMQNGGK